MAFYLAFLLFFSRADGRATAPWSTLYRDGMVVQFSYDHARPVAPPWAGRR